MAGPSPGVPPIHPIANSDLESRYVVDWIDDSQWLTDYYVLEEALCDYFCDECDDATIVDSGTTTRWSPAALGNAPATYLYRVRDQNVTGYGDYSKIEAATIVPEPSPSLLAAAHQLDKPGELSSFLLDEFEWVYHDGCISYWPEQFYELGEGDCKDFARLASSVLAYHGYYAEVVSYSGYRPDDTRFGHVVVIYERPDGVLRYMSNGEVMGEVESVQELLEQAADNANARIGHYLVRAPGTASVCTH